MGCPNRRPRLTISGEAGFRALELALFGAGARRLPGVLLPVAGCHARRFHDRCGGSAGVAPASQFSARRVERHLLGSISSAIQNVGFPNCDIVYLVQDTRSPQRAPKVKKRPLAANWRRRGAQFSINRPLTDCIHVINLLSRETPTPSPRQHRHMLRPAPRGKTAETFSFSGTNLGLAKRIILVILPPPRTRDASLGRKS